MITVVHHCMLMININYSAQHRMIQSDVSAVFISVSKLDDSGSVLLSPLLSSLVVSVVGSGGHFWSLASGDLPLAGRATPGWTTTLLRLPLSSS